jgi:hypothetical protein
MCIIARIDPVIDHTFTLPELSNALHYLNAKRISAKLR